MPGYYEHDNAAHPDAVPVAQTYREGVERQHVGNDVREGIALATWSTAPYKPPKPKAKPKRKKADGDADPTP